MEGKVETFLEASKVGLSSPSKNIEKLNLLASKKSSTLTNRLQSKSLKSELIWETNMSQPLN